MATTDTTTEPFIWRRTSGFTRPSCRASRIRRGQFLPYATTPARWTRTISFCGWVRYRMPTRSISNIPAPTGTRPSSTRPTTSTGRRALYPKLPYNFIRDIDPVATTARTPLVMEVNPSVPVKTVPEFIAYAKANPGKLNMASAGNGNSTHMAGELFKMMADVDMIHVPYRGSAPALTDLLGGQVQVMFDVMASSIAHIRAGKLRALAVTTAMRSEALPDVPIVGDFVPGYEASAVGGVGVPKGTSVEIIDKLNVEINAALADPKMKLRFADLGGTPLPGSPADYGKLIAEETAKWAKVIKFAGIKPE